MFVEDAVRFAIVFTLSVWAAPGAAHDVVGRVLDVADGAPVAGVEVRFESAARSALTDARGQFVLRDVAAGSGDILFRRLGYEPSRRHVEVPTAEIVVRLRSVEFRQDPIVVSATRVQRRSSPVPYDYLSKRDLEDRYTTQDLPVLLSELPSAIHYSDSGNGIGYNYLTLRGFDQRRISVLVNGVPQNDPEDQNVYWLDFPDLAANLQDVQVQRGAGSGFYGPPAIGGSVNLVTALFDTEPSVRVSTGAGSFDTQRYSLELQSGLVDGTYAFYGRYSKLLSDGYRRDSWVDFTSYFFGAARYDASMSTRLHVYGGPIADGLAYYGVPRSALGDRTARRQNALAGGVQIENFSQPHYELLHDWRLSERLRLSNTLFYVQGDGFFDFDGSWADTTYFRLTREFGFAPTGDPGSSIVRAFVGNEQGGWLPRLDWQHDRGRLSVGAELRIHRSLHWGSVRWAQNLPEGVGPNRRFYEYRGGKDILGAYAHEELALRDNLQLTGDLQLVFNRYRIFDEAFVGNDIATPYFFANPRLGLNHNFTPRAHAYASYGYVQREPRLKNLYDAAESSGGTVPQFETRPGGGLDFDAPLVRPEKLHDFEVGAGWRTPRFGVDANLYWMDFRDEIVKKGELDRFGQPVTGNAARSTHRGLEVGMRARPWEPVEVSGNVTWSRNHLEDHVVFEDGDGGVLTAGLQLGGNRIAGFPDFIANLRTTTRLGPWTASLAGRYVGSFFTTNFEAVDRRVSPHFALEGDLAWGLDWGGTEARVHLQVRNLLDRLYVLHGEGDDYFPAATRSFFGGVEYAF